MKPARVGRSMEASPGAVLCDFGFTSAGTIGSAAAMAAAAPFLRLPRLRRRRGFGRSAAPGSLTAAACAELAAPGAAGPSAPAAADAAPAGCAAAAIAAWPAGSGDAPAGAASACAGPPGAARLAGFAAVASAPALGAAAFAASSRQSRHVPRRLRRPPLLPLRLANSDSGLSEPHCTHLFTDCWISCLSVVVVFIYLEKNGSTRPYRHLIRWFF